MSRADRIRDAKAALRTKGYSANVAAAVAELTDDPAGSEWRDWLLAAAGRSGIKDGPGRGYLVRLVGHHLRLGPYPSAPATLGPAEVRFIDQRAAELVAELHKAGRPAGHTP